MDVFMKVLDRLREWRDRRLPPPRVSQSEVSKDIQICNSYVLTLGKQYDKIGLTRVFLRLLHDIFWVLLQNLVLQWIWAVSHSAQASLLFPYIIPMMFVPHS